MTHRKRSGSPVSILGALSAKPTVCAIAEGIDGSGLVSLLDAGLPDTIKWWDNVRAAISIGVA